MLPPLVLGAVLIGVWYFVSYVVLAPRRRFLLPAAPRGPRVGFLDSENLGEILDGLTGAPRCAVIGLAIAIVLGHGDRHADEPDDLIERAIFPFIVMLQAIPILAIVPLISFWCGTGETLRVIVCVIISLFPIIVNTLFGLQSADRGDARPVHAAARQPGDPLAQADVPRRATGDLRRAAHLGRALGDRRDRRRLLLRPGQAGIGQLLKRYANQPRRANSCSPPSSWPPCSASRCSCSSAGSSHGRSAGGTNPAVSVERRWCTLSGRG